MLILRMDHKLKVFKEVALNKSFTKAAENLFMSQPAVSKTIKNLEQEYGKAFFIREGNSIDLTDEGHIFFAYAEKVLGLYAAMEDEFLTEDAKLPQHVTMGASTTIGQYVIPRIAAQIARDRPDFRFQLRCGNTEEIQGMILNGQLDFGLVEGDNHNARLHYETFVRDELVLVANSQNRQVKSESIAVAQLRDLTFVEREPGSGTREVIVNALKKYNPPPLKIIADLGSTESIKTYLRYSDSFAFMSIHSIDRELLEGHLRVIEVEGLSIERWFYFVKRQGYQSKAGQKLQNLFMEGYRNQ